MRTGEYWKGWGSKKRIKKIEGWIILNDDDFRFLALDNEEDLKALLLCTMNEILDMLLKVEAKDNIFQDFEWC